MLHCFEVLDYLRFYFKVKSLRVANNDVQFNIYFFPLRIIKV